MTIFVLGLYSIYFGCVRKKRYFCLELTIELSLVTRALLLMDGHVAEWLRIAKESLEDVGN